MDKIAVSLEVVQSTQYELKAMILNQESAAKERRKLEEQMATQNKSYYETLMVRWANEWNYAANYSECMVHVFVYIPVIPYKATTLVPFEFNCTATIIGISI